MTYYAQQEISRRERRQMVKRAAWRALAAGCGAGLVLAAVMLTLRLWITAPAFPERVADQVLLLVPQEVLSVGIDRFGNAAKPLLFVGLVTLLVVIASLVGLLYGLLAVALAGWLDLTNPVVGSAAGLLLALAIDAILPNQNASLSSVSQEWSSYLPALLLAGLPGLAYGLALTILLRLLTPPRPRRDPRSGALGSDRRASTRRSLLALLLPAVSALVTVAALRRLTAGPGTAGQQAQELPSTATPTSAPTVQSATPSVTLSAAPTLTPGPSPSVTTPPVRGASYTGTPTVTESPTPFPTTGSTATSAPTGTPAPMISPTATGPRIPTAVAAQITPVPLFYVVSKNLIDPTVSREGWQLTIGGLVGQPQMLRYTDLLLLPPARLAATLECISNDPGGPLIGTAIWTGVALRTLLTRASPRPAATHVIFTCADGYVEYLTLAQALDPTTLLVYAMNDAPLTEKHGFPARLLAAGRYGMKHPKWVVAITLVDMAVSSYWSQRGWSPDAPVQVFTRIDAPSEALPVGPIDIGGMAFAGDRGISRVEVSTGRGAIWLPATIEPALSPMTWVRWVVTWRPPAPGTYTLAARAYEADGTPQEARTSTLNPRGSTGYGLREVTITP